VINQACTERRANSELAEPKIKTHWIKDLFQKLDQTIVCSKFGQYPSEPHLV